MRPSLTTALGECTRICFCDIAEIQLCSVSRARVPALFAKELCTILKWKWTVLSDTRRNTPDESYSAASDQHFGGAEGVRSATASDYTKPMIRRGFWRGADLAVRPGQFSSCPTGIDLLGNFA